MNDLQRAISHVRARMTFNLALTWSATGLTAGLAVAALTVLATRLTGVVAPTWIYAALAGVGLAAGLARAWQLRPDPLTVAVRIDRRLALKDRVGTAQAVLAGGSAGPEVAQWITTDAQQALRGKSPRLAAPIELSRVWLVAAATAAVFAGCFAFVPQLDAAPWAGGPVAAADDEDEEQTEAEREDERRQREEIAEEIDALRQQLSEEDDEQAAEELAALEDLARQLERGSGDFERDRDEAAAAMDEMARRMQREASRQQQSMEDLAQRFQGMDTPQAPMQGREFLDALKSGEYGEAADIMEELFEQRGELSPEQRAAMADTLRSISEQARARDQREELNERREMLEEAMRDAGAEEQTIDDLLNGDERDRDEIERQLRQEGLDNELARQMADQVEEQRGREAVDQQANDAADELADRMDDLADEFDDSDSDPADNDQQSGDDQQQGQQQQQQQDQKQDQQQENEQSCEKCSNKDCDGSQCQGGQQSGGQSGQQQSGQQQGEQQQSGDQQQSGGEQQQQQGRQQSGQQSEGQCAGSAACQGLRGLQSMKEQARQQAQSGESMQQQSQRMADSRSEQEQQEMNRWSQGSGTEGAGTGGANAPDREEPRQASADITDDIELPKNAPGDQLMAEWLTQGEVVEGEAASRSGSVGEARRAAERAVDDQAVPARYHDAIRRYFQRFERTVDEAAAPDPDSSGDSGS